MKRIIIKWYKWRINENFLKVSLISLLFSAFFMQAYAGNGINDNLNYIQGIKVTGVVTDSDNLPIPGVSIIEKGTMNGTVSDFDGKYVITVSSSEAVLVFSFIGYNTEEAIVGSRSVVDMLLLEDVKSLEEVVVVGYGVQKKSDVTGAMINVDSEELNQRPVANAFEALQGKAAGVDITSSERPGELGSIRIRGVRSLSASSDPLYVVDGVPLMSSSAIETINPKDIESIDVLKDASATAIYGSRGANGVIIVTTKKGKDGEFSLNYSGTVTLENVVDKNPSMSASDYITWRRWAYYFTNPDYYPRGDEPTYENDKAIFYTGLEDETAWANIQKGWGDDGSWDGSKVTNTDWTKYVTRTGISQVHTLSASGGTEKMQAYGSFGYLDQKGTQIGQAYKRYNANLSLDITPKTWFKMGGSINASMSDQDYGMSTTGSGSSSSANSILAAAKKIYNYALPYDSVGEVILNPGGEENVYTVIGEEDLSENQRQMFRAIGSFYGVVNIGDIIKPLEGLNYRVNFGPDYRFYRKGVYINDESVVRTSYGTSYASLSNQRDFSWTLDNIITYNKEFGIHSLGLTLLQTASSWNIESSSMSGENIPKPSYLWNAFDELDITDSDYSASMGSDLTERTLTSYMARANYSLNEKYLLTVSGRYDGASQLSEGHKWAFFPSAALGWRISQEDFMASVTWVDQLKLRFGAGTTGSSSVDPYSTLGNVSSLYVPFGGESNALAYVVNEPNYNIYNALANDDLTWERTTQYNLGIDFSIVGGRIGGAFDVYKSYTNDVIMETTIPIPTGYNSTYANVGKTKNMGFDITINTVNIDRGDFQWSSGLNAAWQKDEIVELAYGKNDMIDNNWFIGQSLSVYYDVAADGIWQEEDADEMAAFNENGHDFEVGQTKPIDQNGDYKIDDEDRVVLGHKLPRWTLGFNNTFNYKDFELGVVIYGRLGYMTSTGGQYQGGRYNQTELDYWTPDNTDAQYQRPEYSEAGGDAYYALLGYMSGSYIKLRNISLGYYLPKKYTERLNIQSLKIFAQAKNLGMIYSAIDFTDMDTGSSYFNRGFTFGVDVSF